MLFLIAGISILGWHYVLIHGPGEETHKIPETDPFALLLLYSMQGLNLTALHAPTALFGVCGMLGIALVLFCLRGLRAQMIWDTRALKTSFWCLNIGLALMGVLTLLSLGTMQVLAAIEHGYWYSRSAEFMQKPIVEMLIWMRMSGDILFSIGALALCWFVFRLWVAPGRDALADAPIERAKH